VGAVGGKAEIMSELAPAGSVYQAGTLSGHPLAMVAGLATLEQLLAPGAYEAAADAASDLTQGIGVAAERVGLRVEAASAGTMLGFTFLRDDAPADRPITDAVTARDYADTDRYGRFFRACLDRGVYFAPSQFEVAFTSTAHTGDDIARTLEIIGEVFTSLND
jgi:glutamate-1-semialdehyde 2,1-aminomutase